MKRAWLKQLRAERDLTQTALATATGIKPARYSRIESGYCDLRDEEAAQLAKVLKQTVEFIQSGSSKPETQETKQDTAKARPDQAAVEIQPSKIPSAPVVAPKGLAAANSNEPPRPSARGDDLSDPKNFTLLPPTEILASGASAGADFKTRLQQHIAFAEKVLHTSKVCPKVWVAWRDFNKAAQNLLRTGPAVLPPLTIERKAPPVPSAPAAVTPDPSAPRKPQSRNSRGNKNIFGYFVEVAKEALPPEKYEALSTQAMDAKTLQPEIGFMKHFKRIAEAELSPTDFSKLAAEAAHRFSS